MSSLLQIHASGFFVLATFLLGVSPSVKAECGEAWTMEDERNIDAAVDEYQDPYPTMVEAFTTLVTELKDRCSFNTYNWETDIAMTEKAQNWCRILHGDECSQVEATGHTIRLEEGEDSITCRGSPAAPLNSDNFFASLENGIWVVDGEYDDHKLVNMKAEGAVCLAKCIQSITFQCHRVGSSVPKKVVRDTTPH